MTFAQVLRRRKLDLLLLLPLLLLQPGKVGVKPVVRFSDELFIEPLLPPVGRWPNTEPECRVGEAAAPSPVNSLTLADYGASGMDFSRPGLRTPA